MDSAILPAAAAYLRSSRDVLDELGSNAERGLSQSEVAVRLERHGPNELRMEPPVPGWRKLLAQFQDSLVILLLIATAVSAGLWFFEGDAPLPYEALAIFAVVLFNAIMGYLQESRAESAVAALRQLTAVHTSVLRDGERRSVRSRELVPGDVMLVEEGDSIGADARLLEAIGLQTAEAALTGESLPVTKRADAIEAEAGLGDRTNMIWSGTVVTYGRGRAVVTGTGMQTEIGRIAGLLHAVTDESTPLQKQLDRMGRMLGLTVIAIAMVMIATIVLIEHVSSPAQLVEVLILGVALAVAAVPEGLPAVVTAVLSIGVQRMARRHAIVRQLRAVETLGSADVIASDKTGTLTRNEMTVRVVATCSGEVTFGGSGYAPQGEVRREAGAIEGALRDELELSLRIAERANNAVVREDAGRWSAQGDPTEGALVVAARKYGLDPAALAKRWPRVGEVPFSSERKLMSTVHRDAEDPSHVLVFTKGAPDVLLERCSQELEGAYPRELSAARRAELTQLIEALAARGLRSLGLAFRSVPAREMQIDSSIEHGLVFAGLIGMLDPARDEARDAVARAKAAGIRPIMITGDHPVTAGVIAVDLGIADDPGAVTGRELARMSASELADTVQRVSIYARVDPEHKLRIVEELARQGAVVAMTGDGVNDAPALKSADIGIAMGITGTEVSKQAADIVLADDNFATIVAAVEEGRIVFSNIRKFLRYLLSSNIGEVMAMFLGVILAGPLGLHGHEAGLVLPLMAAQLLWINLVTDSAPALALGVDPAEPGLMSQRPRPRNEGVLTREMWSGIVYVGALMAAVTLFTLDASLPGGLVEGHGDLVYAQTRAFTTLMLCQMFNVLNARSDRRSAFVRPFDNPRIWVAIGLSVALQLAVVYFAPLQKAFSTTPLSLADWVICTALASSVLWLRELYKLTHYLRVRHPAAATHGHSKKYAQLS